MERMGINELKKLVGYNNEVQNYKKKVVKIIRDKKQFSIRVPKKFAEVMKIDGERDTFEFHLIPNKSGGFILEARLAKWKGNSTK